MVFINIDETSFCPGTVKAVRSGTYRMHRRVSVPYRHVTDGKKRAATAVYKYIRLYFLRNNLLTLAC